MRAGGGGIEWEIADHGEAGSGTHFHDGFEVACIANLAITGCHGAVLGVASRCFTPFAPQGGDHGFGGAFAAVSDGTEVAFG